jgi:hypothetical protein
MIIFGSSLRAEDAHLVRAINEQAARALGISVRPVEASSIIQRKAELRSAFPTSDLFFFDSESCPLGDPSMRVNPHRFSFLRR